MFVFVWIYKITLNIMWLGIVSWSGDKWVIMALFF